MKKIFAIPTLNGQLCAHFGHCEKFALIETEDDAVTGEKMVTPPNHQPGVYPRFLADLGVHVIIAGGIGQRAQQLFASHDIQVCTGVSGSAPVELVEQYLSGRLQTGANLCDH